VHPVQPVFGHISQYHFMSLEKVAVTFELVGTWVAPSEGLTEVTVGHVAVVKDQT
jgi:hypothetical protein